MLKFTKNLMKRLRRDERGLTAVEYAVLGAVVVAAIAALRGDFTDALSGAFTGLFNQIS